MKYSFVVIAFNEQENIIACIESVLAQNQLGESYEIIVVDDGSKDKTSELVEDLSKSNKRIKLMGDGRNHGRGYGRYVGVKASQGEYVVMVDADIILPEDWLTTCLKYVEEFDVVGGIAVPDGDVAYVYRRFQLQPKVVAGSTTITGNNGLYKREVFTKLNFDKNLRDGEDVDFNHRLAVAGMSEFCIPDLTVEHQEAKSLLRSMLWLYQSGVGATRQLIRFREIRLPDLVFVLTLAVTLVALTLTLVTGNAYCLLAPLVAVLCTSFMHIRSKFYFAPMRLFANALVLLINEALLFCYYSGRVVGPFIYARGNKK